MREDDLYPELMATESRVRGVDTREPRLVTDYADLVSVGPKSLTWPRSKKPEDGWKEVFNPNANPVVKALTIQGVHVPSADRAGAHVPCDNVGALVHARRLSLNPDFPRSMPRGGTGSGRVIEPTFE